MQYLKKSIRKIFLIDVFTPDERLNSQTQVTVQLEKFLHSIKGLTLSVYPNYSNSKKEVFDFLEKIKESAVKDEGIIIHIIGHGDSGALGFGNGKFYVTWDEVAPFFCAINVACDNSLIMNTTCICFGYHIFKLKKGKCRPFYAAIGSKTKNSLQALHHNKMVYEKCQTKDMAVYWWNHQNEMLAINKAEGYEITYS